MRRGFCAAVIALPSLVGPQQGIAATVDYPVKPVRLVVVYPPGGGNGTFTEGLMRCVYNGVDDIRALSPGLTDEEVASADFGAYTEERFFDDMARITQNRTDSDLCGILVTGRAVRV